MELIGGRGGHRGVFGFRSWSSLYGWMDGWMDGWMGRWVNGWMDGWLDYSTEKEKYDNENNERVIVLESKQHFRVESASSSSPSIQSSSSSTRSPSQTSILLCRALAWS